MTRISAYGHKADQDFSLAPLNRATLFGATRRVIPLNEQNFYSESKTTKPARLNCPYCREVHDYPLRWMVRKKRERLPRGADERDRAKFQKAQSYMVLLDDRANCKNPRCRRGFEISGIKTMTFL